MRINGDCMDDGVRIFAAGGRLFRLDESGAPHPLPEGVTGWSVEVPVGRGRHKNHHRTSDSVVRESDIVIAEK